MSETPQTERPTAADSPEATVAPDACPQCGGRTVPVLDGRTEGPGPLLADPPVRLVCPPCSEGSAHREAPRPGRGGSGDG